MLGDSNPASAIRESVIVVFPWSMWAIMPMLRMASFLCISLRISFVCLNFRISFHFEKEGVFLLTLPFSGKAYFISLK
jgi:hypothetical protein